MFMSLADLPAMLHLSVSQLKTFLRSLKEIHAHTSAFAT
jgi:hypothetical protein